MSDNDDTIFIRKKDEGDEYKNNLEKAFDRLVAANTDFEKKQPQVQKLCHTKLGARGFINETALIENGGKF